MKNPSKTARELIQDKSEAKHKQTKSALRESKQNYRLLATYHKRLNDISIVFAGTSGTEDLFNRIAECFRFLTDAIAAVFTVYDQETRTLKVVAQSSDPTSENTLSAIFGTESVEARVPVSADDIENMLSSGIKRPKDLCELSRGVMPQEISDAIMDSIGCRQIITIAISYAAEVVGTCVAFLPGNHPMVPDDALKTYAYLSGMAIKRSRTEEALRASEGRFRFLAENSTDAVWTMALDGTITYTSPSTINLTGYTPEEAMQMPLREQLVESSVQRVIALLASQLQKTQSERLASDRIEVQQYCKDGSIKDVEITVGWLLNDSGDPIGVQGSSRDITSRKQAENALRESEQKYRLLIENSGDIVWTIDLEGHLTYVSPRVNELLGYTADEVMAMPMSEYLAQEDYENVIRMLSEELARPPEERLSSMNLHVRYKKKDGCLVDAEIKTSWYMDDRDSIIGLQGVTRDITERKQGEEALRESEKKYRLLADNVNDVIFIFDMNFQYTYVTPAVKILRGYEPAEVLQQHPSDALTPSSWDLAIKTLTEVMEVENSDKREIRVSRTLQLEMTRKDGTTVWTEVMFSFIRDENQQPVNILGVARDIAARKQAEEALRESETKLQAVFDTVGTGIIIIDKHTQTIIEANQTAIKMTGLPKERIVGQICHSLVCPAEVGKCPVKDLGQSIDDSERKLLCSDGYLKDILKTVCPLTIKGKECYVESFIDISERKRAEEAIKASVSLLDASLESTADGILIVNSEGKIIKWNKIFAEIWQLSEGILSSNDDTFVIGHILSQLSDPEQFLDKVKYLYSNPGKSSFDQIEFLNGSIIERYSQPQRIGDDIVGRVWSFRDISERKRAEEEKQRMEERLQRSGKMEALGQLAGGVAHDLNNVLGALSGYSELLLMQIPEGQRARCHVEKIMQSIEKGAAIIQDLLTLARRGVAESEVVNLNSVVLDFLQTPVLERIKDYHPRVTFKTEIDKNLLNIKGSPVHLEKTLMNLVSNAAESIFGEGEVTIRTESRYLDKPVMGYDEVREGEYTILTVTDTGMGILDEHREKIFEPFYTKKKMGRSGTGLGLAIVWGTVRDHKGYIDLQTKVGEGTSFTLYFPVTREELIVPPQKVPPEQYMGRGEAVLVVDDIAEQREVASGLLEQLGYKVQAVSSGEEAVEHLKSNKADILVLDMIMDPGIDGLETYRRILEVNPQQKAIIVSGFSETERVREAQKLGAGAYVRKPYAMEKIGMAIRNELRS